MRRKVVMTACANASAPLLGAGYNTTEGDFPVPISARGEDERRTVIAKLRSGEYRLEDRPCLCGGTDEELICTVDRYRIPHRTVLCPACGLVRTNPRMDAAAYEDFYTRHYRAIYERPGHTAETLFAFNAARAKRRATFIGKNLRTYAAAKVLELGCGGGWNLIPLREAGCAVEGYDYDDDYLAAGRARGLALQRGGIDDALQAGGRFDVVLLSHVVEHLLDPSADLRRLARLLRPGGLLYVEVPNLFAVTTDLPRYWQGAHTYSFVPETLTRLMEGCGWRAVAMDAAIASLWSAGPLPQTTAGMHGGALANRTRKFLRNRERRAWLRRRLAWAHALWVRLHARDGDV